MQCSAHVTSYLYWISATHEAWLRVPRAWRTGLMELLLRHSHRGKHANYVVEVGSCGDSWHHA